MLELSEIAALREGRRDPILVGEFPLVVQDALKLKVNSVYISLASLKHIERRHTDVTDFDLLLLPVVLRNGLYLQEKTKRNIIISSYHDSISGRRFVAVSKIAANKFEIYVSSFYRTKPRQTRRFLERCEIIRTHI